MRPDVAKRISQEPPRSHSLDEFACTRVFRKRPASFGDQAVNLALEAMAPPPGQALSVL